MPVVSGAVVERDEVAAIFHEGPQSRRRVDEIGPHPEREGSDDDRRETVEIARERSGIEVSDVETEAAQVAPTRSLPPPA